jgi:hypothetical protein
MVIRILPSLAKFKFSKTGLIECAVYEQPWRAYLTKFANFLATMIEAESRIAGRPAGDRDVSLRGDNQWQPVSGLGAERSSGRGVS